MLELVKYKKFAIGYDYSENKSFIKVIEPYISTIKEVYFSWPGMISGRPVVDAKITEKVKAKLFTDLSWCRSNNIMLDLLFNANCYGEIAYSETLRYQVYDIIEELKSNGLFPEVVTTTSQYIAKVIKIKYPEIDIRASVNMRIESTKSMEFISDIFDSFYICRDIQRNLDTIKRFYDWSEKHNKKMCLLANSSCLRCCPVQIWHDNFICHENWRGEEQEFILRYPYRLCGRHLSNDDNLVDVLRMSWIRPEDLHYYEPFVHTIKLATRRTSYPELMLQAYCQGSYDGNLLEVIGINRKDIIFDNKSFPDNWVESKIAQDCALNCNECGKCQMLLKKILKTPVSSKPTYYFVNKSITF